MKQPTTAIYNAALYLRLSKDDGLDNMESSSIQTQKEMLTRYCRENGIIIADYYVDDGYSGTNFDRPSFKKMIADIEDGKINCVITKDLSRLGRNYLESGAYIEIFFPEHNVRYIALNDGVDTLRATSMEITPFRNLLNDMYAKDISNKIKSALLTRQKQGKFIGTKAPYGYKKDPNDKNHLIIDESYAPIVRRIFEMSKGGMGINAISKQLRKEKIPRPAAAACEIIPSYDRYTEGDEKVYAWTFGTVREILANPVYAGHIRGQKRPKISMKSGKRKTKEFAGTFIVENCHEPIIAPKEWETVQRLITSRRRTRAEGKPKYDNIFSGLLKCDCCGYSLTPTHANRRNRPEVIDNYAYQCNTYRMNGREACTHHWLEARDLHEAILADIKRIAKAAIKNDEELTLNIVKKLRKTDSEKLKQDEKDLRKANTRLAELDRLFAKLYEEHVSEKITDRNYNNLSAAYEKEQLELEDRIDRLNAVIKESKQNNSDAENFVEMIKGYADITELSAAMLNTLIDKIVVHEAEVIDGEKVQRLDVYYKFVGIVD